MSSAPPGRFDTLLAPNSVAVIGSLSSPDKVGARTIDHLRRAGYRGDVQAARKVDDLVGAVDVAVVAVPAAAVPEVLGALRGRATHAVVYSSGFGEAGGDTVARFHDEALSVLGPNTVGLYVARTATALAFAQALGPVIDEHSRRPASPDPDDAALVTQSGAFGARLTSSATKRGIGLGTFIATGNEDGYTLPDVLEGLAVSSVVAPRVVLVYIEAVRDGRRLQTAVRSLVAQDVEVLALVGGRTASGAQAATSHTAALATDGGVLTEALRAAGAIVVDGDRELLDGLAALALQRRAKGRRAAVLTGSGGAGVIAADLLAARGVTLPRLSEGTRQLLASALPEFAATDNPIDVTAAAIGDVSTLAACAAALAGSGEVDVLLTVGRSTQAATIQRAAAPLPTVAAVLDATTDELRDLAAGGVLAAGDLTSASSMVATLATRLPEAAGGDGALGSGRAGNPLTAPPSASESLRLVERYGIATAPWRQVATAGDAAAAARQLGWPVVVKADLPAVVHKAQAGGVRLDVTADGLTGVLDDLLADTAHDGGHGLIIASQRRGSLELIAGARVDPHFGIVVVAGIGGSNVELLARTVSLPVDVSAAWLAGRIEQVALRGTSPPGTAQRLATAALALARLVRDTGAGAAECNPLIDTESGLIALDARVVLL